MTYLLGALKAREKASVSAAFLAIGLLAQAIGPSIKKHLPKISEAVRMSLPIKDATAKYVLFNWNLLLQYSICLLVIADVSGVCLLDSVLNVNVSVVAGSRSCRPSTQQCLHVSAWYHWLLDHSLLKTSTI